MTAGNGGKLPLRALVLELARASSGQKLRVIIDAHDPVALVRSLPPEDLYFTIQSIGFDDSAALVHMATAVQFRALVDLDVWKSNEPRLDRLLLWLSLARDPDDDEASQRKIDALDIELIELLLKNNTVLYDLAEDENPEFEATLFSRTPEGKWIVVYEGESVEAHATKRLLDDLYAQDPFRAARLLEAVRWEMESELTETALRWRNGRLRDLGFPSLDEAMELFAPVPPKAAPGPEPLPGDVPPAFPVLAEKGELLDRAAAGLDELDRIRFEHGLVYVANSVMVAEQLEPNDLAAVARALGYARGLVSLGLWQASDGEPTRAVNALHDIAPKRLFQSGFATTLELKRRADRVAPRLTLPGAQTTALDPPEGPMLAGLRRRRPRFYDPADVSDAAEIAPEAVGGGWRAFSTPHDLLTARAALDLAELAADALEALGWDRLALARVAEDVDRPPGAVTVSGAYLTYAAHAVLGRAPQWSALSRSDLGNFAAVAYQNGALSPAAQEKLRRPLQDASPEAASRLWERILAVLDEAIAAPLRAGEQPDLRFVGGLLVRP